MQKLPMRHPQCPTPRHCEIRDLGSSTTLMGWTPVFDGDGNLLNMDPNTVTTMFSCNTCGKKWVRKNKADDVTFQDID